MTKWMVACVLVLAGLAMGQGKGKDPLGENMIPPDLLMRYQDELGLSPEQMEFIRGKMQEAQGQMAENQKTLQQEMESLGWVLGQEHPESDKALEQLDRVLDAERQIKRTQVAMLVAIKGKLTPQQVAKAKELRKKMIEEVRNRKPLPESLQAKMQQVQELMHKAQEQGKDLKALEPIKREMGQLLHDEKYKEAEEALDRAIKTLE